MADSDDSSGTRRPAGPDIGAAKSTPLHRKCYAPAADRNREPIVSVLKRILPREGRVLEIASGTGQHVVAFARALPALKWCPSDADADARGSISAWIEDAGLPNIRQPQALDVTAPDWPERFEAAVDAVLAINLIHISAWAATEGLMRGAGALLAPGGLLYLYGPFKRCGVHTAPSNAAFDASLRAQNTEWGVREISDVEAEAGKHGLSLAEIVEMPANNLSLVFTKA